MIINRIRSEHVLKYAQLDLNHLPPRGLIAVSGPNESGKSTIGEIMCFALFGRTFSLRPDEIVNLIRWGEPRGSASLDFSIDEAQYRISRFFVAPHCQYATAFHGHFRSPSRHTLLTHSEPATPSDIAYSRKIQYDGS
jgi:hypothetical protein